MKIILQVLVVAVDALGDLVARRARRDGRDLEAAGPGLQRQGDLAGVGGDDRVHLVLVRRALEGADRVGGGVVVVVGDDLDHTAIHAAVRIDLVCGDHGGVGDGDAADSGVLGDHADADRIGGMGRAGHGDGQGEGGQQVTQRHGTSLRRAGVHRRYAKARAGGGGSKRPGREYPSQPKQRAPEPV